MFRFFLAAMVMLFHVFNVLAAKPTPGTFLGFTNSGVGILGVCCFFFLSGFLVTHMSCTYRYWKYPKLFILNRALRIYPTYIFVLIVSAAVLGSTRNYLMLPPVGVEKIATVLGANWIAELLGEGIIFWNKGWAHIVVFARNTMSLNGRGDWNPVLWTIDVELRAYAVIGILLFLTKNYLPNIVTPATSNHDTKIGRGWWQIVAISLVVIALGAAVDAFAFLLNPINIGLIYVKGNMNPLLIMHLNGASFLFFSPMFLFGGLLALARQQVIDPKRGRVGALFFAIVSIGCYYYWLIVQTNVPNSYRLLALSLYVTLLASAFSLIECDLGRGAKGKLRYWDSFLGDMAYPLYLINFPVAVWMSKSITEPAIYVVSSVVVAILVAAFVVRVAETPLKSIRRRLTETRGTTNPAILPTD